jgi:hypothetical protein
LAIAKLEQLLNNKPEEKSAVLPSVQLVYQITDATKAEKKEYLQNILNRVMHKS